MHFIGPASPGRLDWHSLFGRSREDIISGILEGDWLHLPDAARDAEAVLAVEELSDAPFTLVFNCYASGKLLDKTRERWGDGLYKKENRHRISTEIDLTLIFAHGDDPACIKLDDVHFHNASHRKMGSRFLTNMVGVALDIGADRLAVYPGMEGSSFWTSRGAMIQNPAVAFRNLAPSVRLILQAEAAELGWTQADFDEFHRVFDRQDVMGLQKLIARDDLLLKGEKFRHAVVNNSPLGLCLFDLNHPWTRDCLLERTGFDVEAEKNRRARPARERGLKTSAPAF
ncbi:MAG: hypothetical protein P4M15_03305 [Alphaproteobacteria bacterium]|nr:hypothetical protein [Alphaproteobacteria bacterium]